MKRKEKFKELVDSEKGSEADITIKFELYQDNGKILLLRAGFNKGKAFTVGEGEVNPSNIEKILTRCLNKTIEKAKKYTIASFIN